MEIYTEDTLKKKLKNIIGVRLHLLKDMKTLQEISNEASRYNFKIFSDRLQQVEYLVDNTRKEMKQVLTEIQDGTFASNWILENQAGKPRYWAMKEKELQHPIIETGKKLRSMMSWINKPAEGQE